MKKPQIRFRSFYAKLVIMFLFMGLIPFLLMGMLIYNVYSNTMYENILGNFSMTDQIMAKNISDLITEIADDTEYIYKSSVSDYDYFYEEDKKTQADMVFLHRAGQLPISAWKEIRQSLKYTRGVKEVMKVDVDAAYEAGCIARDKYEKTDRYYKRRDLFSFAIEYDTMFFSGGWYAFMDLFIDLKEMLDLPLEDRLDDKAIYGPYYLDDYISFWYDCKNPKFEGSELGFYDRNVLTPRKA